MTNENQGEEGSEVEFPQLVSDLLRMHDELVSAVAFTVERQAAMLANLTEREPSSLPVLAPLIAKALELFTAPTGGATAPMGPRERKVVAEYELDHARLLRELEEKRAIARAEDSAPKGAPSSP